MDAPENAFFVLFQKCSDRLRNDKRREEIGKKLIALLADYARLNGGAV